MVYENFDREIKDSLIKGTKDSTQMKDDIWLKIQQRIEPEKNTEERITVHASKKNWNKRTTTLSLAATLLFAVLIATTEPGQAIINNVKEFFIPEKVIKHNMEGIEGKTKVALHEGKAGYVIYFDKERYSLVQANGKDRIVLNEKLKGDVYRDLPEIYMEITQQENEPSDAAAQRIYEQVKAKYRTVLELQQVKQPVRGFVIYAVDGTGGKKWSDPVVRYYVFSNQKGGSFVIKQQYFLEAEEGHGERFNQMLKELHILKSPNE